MMRTFSDWLLTQARLRATVVSRAGQITFQPSLFAREARVDADFGVASAFRFFLTCVGLILAIEAVFSLVFDTAFSDLVHHAFPVLVVLFGGIMVYAVLKSLLTSGVSLGTTMATTLYVGGAAILVMVLVIFAMLTVDFLVSYDDVKASPCKDRTIICLLSGGTLTEYDAPRRTTGALGSSFPFILAVIIATLVHFSRVLAISLRETMAVQPWRTYIAAGLSVLILSPAALLAINAIYRALYR